MTGRGGQSLAEVAELADRIAATVMSCPDVAGLTQNPGIPVATYLPGRTVSGVAVRPAEVEISVMARYGRPLAQVAAQVRQAVEPLVPGRVVDVVIGDIAAAGAPESAVASLGRHQAECHKHEETGESANG